jgi:pantetheine-phosphate adenylyltransferase
MSHTILFPGTFDPITNGHLDLIERASHLFTHVIIGVAEDTFAKNPVFKLKERLAFVQAATKKYKNVKAISFDGLTVACAKEHGAKALLRGLRSGNDLPLELQMAAMNRHLAPEIDTIFLAPTPEYSHISASLVRQIAQLHGDVSELVPKEVALALRKHYA